VRFLKSTGSWYKTYTNYLREAALLQIKPSSNLISCFLHNSMKKKNVQRYQNKVREKKIVLLIKTVEKNLNIMFQDFSQPCQRQGCA